MKKLLSMMILVLAITFCLQVVDESVVSADYTKYIEYRGHKIYYYEYGILQKVICINCGKIDYYHGNSSYEAASVILRNGDCPYNYGDHKWVDAGYSTYRKSNAEIQEEINRKKLEIDEQIEREHRKLEDKKRQEEEARRKEEERLNKFNALIAEGDKYYTAKDYENARKAYQQARQINSSKVDEYCNNLIKNGDNLFNQKLYDSAKDYYKKAEIMGKEVEPKNPEKLQELGNNYSYAKQYERALDYYTKAISLLSDESNYEYRYDKIENKPHFINTGNPNSEKYRGVWTKILGYTSYISNIAKCYYQMGLCYENLDNINKAVEMYKNVISEYDADSFKKRSKSYKQLKSDAKKKISELKKKQNKN